MQSLSPRQVAARSKQGKNLASLADSLEAKQTEAELHAQLEKDGIQLMREAGKDARKSAATAKAAVHIASSIADNKERTRLLPALKSEFEDMKAEGNENCKDMKAEMNKRFTEVNERFTEVNERFTSVCVLAFYYSIFILTVPKDLVQSLSNTWPQLEGTFKVAEKAVPYLAALATVIQFFTKVRQNGDRKEKK
jgi:hypothetical protein